MGPGDKKKKDECNPFENCVKNRKFSDSHIKRQKPKKNVPSGGEDEMEDDDMPMPKKSHINPRMMGSPGSASK